MTAPPGVPAAPALQLRPLRAEDVDTIAGWPPYLDELAPLDYALRRGGWLDQFPPSPPTRRFGAWQGTRLVGFALLTDIANGRAELYLALHPHELGRGLGAAVIGHVLAVAFGELHLDTVYLKVRTWHRRGIALYQRLGFVTVAEKEFEIQGRPERFLVMEIARPAAIAPPPARRLT